jgi:PadR family transcriptional regulator, regulatory protein PadR
VGTWTNGPGRRRREYELTAHGQRSLGEERGLWADFVAAVGAALDPPAAMPVPGVLA